ncbi:GlxA family transcriptional regulator [Pedobacter sp. AW31-3R]|uniref:GlxA family transcriptional regulator n=1 Tax=Pedobacter sp. AW31-3R TaxID=3445781 RepID=UPI003FA02D4C
MADTERIKKVVIVAMSGNMLLDFAGPADVFINANHCLRENGSKIGYDVLVVSPTPNKKINTLMGLEMGCQFSALEITTPMDTIIVAGNDFETIKRSDYHKFCNWLALANEKNTRRIGSVCGGAFALAEAGLLDGKKATTHWQLSGRLKREYPLVNVNTNAFYVCDGRIYTSGGVSSGIDLALALVEEDHGRDIAIKVARRLVFYLCRPGFQVQFANLLPVYESSNIAVSLQKWATEHLDQALDVVTIPTHLNMSPRNFTRVFHKQTGLSPAKFIEKLRVETARQYLEGTNMSIENIAEKCGLGNLVSMRRIFLRHLMTTPSDYRRVFQTSINTSGFGDLLQPYSNNTGL